MREIKFRAWFPKEHYDKPHMAYRDAIVKTSEEFRKDLAKLEDNK
jgi:hypothetical protein